MRKPELLWNPDTTARALDIPIEVLGILARRGLVPLPILLNNDTVLWRAADVRKWARALKTCGPFEAQANAYWYEFQRQQKEANNE